MDKVLKNEKIRFILAGSFNTGLDFLLLNCFVTFLHLAPLIGNAMSVSIGIIVSYFLNHYFVFNSKEKVDLKKFGLFILVTGFSSIAIQSLVIWGVEQITMSDWGRSLFIINQLGHQETLELNLAKALAVAIGMIWNFILYKYVIFKNKNESIVDMEEEFQK